MKSEDIRMTSQTRQPLNPRNGPQHRSEQPPKEGLASRTAETLERTSTTATMAAAEAASTIGGHVKELLDAQLVNGADIVGRLGSSTQRAAEDLEQSSPQLAGLVRGIADRMETYAEDLRDQSVDDFLLTASNFTRRQPALVFGLAALAGFLALRTIKSSSSPQRGRSREPYHGA
jgi:hypothetical protein